MPNIIRCQARSEPCRTGDRLESRQQQGQQQGAQQAPGQRDDSCPLTRGGGDGGDSGRQGSGSAGRQNTGDAPGTGTTDTVERADAASGAATDCGGGGGAPPPAPEPLPRVEPLGIEPPEPIAGLALAQAAPALAPGLPRLSRGDLRFADATTDENADDRARALRDVLAAFAAVARDAGKQLERQRGEAGDGAARIADGYRGTERALLEHHRGLDDGLLAHHADQVGALRAFRDGALFRLDAALGAQRLAILRAGGAGRQAIQRKIAATAGRIDQIVGGLIRPYRAILDGAVSETRRDVSTALTSLTQWRGAIASHFSTSRGSRLERARNEAKREAARCRVDEELPRVRCRGEQLQQEFQSIIAPFERTARDSLAPPMRQEADRARRCGFAALSAAVGRSIQSLERTAEQGRGALTSQAAATERQLVQALNGARAGLRQQVAAKQHQLEKEAGRARQRLMQAHDAQQQGIGDAVGGYRQAVVDAAPGGAQGLRGAGVNGAAEVRDSFETLRARWLAQSGQIETGSRAGLFNGLAEFRGSSAAGIAQQQAVLGQQRAQAESGMEQGLGARIDGMARLKDGVAQTAAQWSQDPAQRFATQIARLRGSLTQCQPSFQRSVSGKRGQARRWLGQRDNPGTLFRGEMQEAGARVQGDIERRVGILADELDDLHTSDSVVVGALRGVTRLQGDAVKEVYQRHGGYLVLDIARGVSGDDLDAAYAYLRGDQARGAEYELRASIHWYNDDEARIRETLRALDQDQLRDFVGRDGVQATLNEVRGNLGGVDVQVFDTLIDHRLSDNTRLARADAYDLQDKIGRARSREEINRELARFYGNARARGYGDDVTDADLRRLINDQVAVVRNVTDEHGNVVRGAAADRAVRGMVAERHQAIRRMEQAQEQARCGRAGCRYEAGPYGERRRRFRGAQEDRAFALIEHGVGSTEERIAQLGIEINRAGGGRMEHIDQALVDPRLNPEPPELDPSNYADGRVPQSVRDQVAERRQQALADRQRLLAGAARRYGEQGGSTAGGTGSAPGAGESAGDQVARLLSRGQGDLGRQVIQGLVRDPFPSGKTSSLILEYAAEGPGTNEQLMRQATTRLTRRQIAEASKSYAGRHPGQSLWGLVASETSGQDFLDMELAWMGQPRNDRERAEVALFAVHQQRREAGGLGAALMSGSHVERILRDDEARLRRLVGGSIRFSARGQPPRVTISGGNFADTGRFAGDDRAEFRMASDAARESATRYAKNIDEWANAATTTIAILGAVVATVVTGGGASPLLAAAIAGATGLASMAAKQAIRGGRYGWEEALTDLGMTGVQMLTAGLGQRLQAIAQASRTMGPVQQALLPAVVTGSLDSLGQTVLNDATWSQGFGPGLEEVLAGTLRGALTATAATLGTQALQKIPIGRAAQSFDEIAGGAADAARSPGWRRLGDVAGESTNALSRSAAQSLSSAGGAFLSRGTELGFESLRGKYNGDAGDIFSEMGRSAGQAAIQGIGEGAGEAWRDRNRIRFGLYLRPGWMSPSEYERLRGVTQPRSGTAAAVEGSRFRGDLHQAPQFDDTRVARELHGLIGDGGQLQGRVRPHPDGHESRVRVDLEGGGSVDVQLKVVDDMAAVDGQVPVARFDPSGDGFEVRVSSRADPELVQRALAHELTEIRHLRHPEAAAEDALRPGGAGTRAAGDDPRLSPHDRGRIAEAEWLQRRIDAEQATPDPDPARLRMLTEEMHGLLAHLGVVNDAAAPGRRRELMLAHLSDPRLRAGIEASVRAARENPRLHHHGADHAGALKSLTEQWQRARASGDERAARGFLERIQRTLMRMERIHTDQRLSRRQQQRLDERVAEHIADGELIGALKNLLASETDVRAGHLANDPAAADPDGAQAVRRHFADRPQFQDWPAFRQKYFETLKTRDAADPVDLNRAYHEWASGAYVSTDTGRLRSVLADVRRPDPGFEHQWLGGVKPRPDQDARLAPEQVLEHDLGGVRALLDPASVQAGDLSAGVRRQIESVAAGDDPGTISVGDAAALRHRLLAEARRIDDALKQGGLSPADADRLKSLHHALEHQAIRLAETLGEAAAHRVAERVPGDWEPVALDGRGSGLPDVVYRHRETGQLLIIEAKGGGSQLGTRLGRHGRRRVEQGTRAYLDSLAADMQRSDSAATRALGDEILRQLARPDGIDYRLVKQPFDGATGRAQPPEVGRFDLGPPPAPATQGHRSAAPVPGSGFHGSRAAEGHGALRRVIDRLLGRTLTNRKLARQAGDWIARGEGIGGRIVPRPDGSGQFQLELPGRPPLAVDVEVVPARSMPLHEGRRANADWSPEPPGARIRVSADMDPRQVERALAHEFREVFEHRLGRKPHRDDGAGEHRLDLDSPHGRARLEELHWLAGRMDGADPDAAFAAELGALLRHLGADAPDASPAALARRSEILARMQDMGLRSPAAWRALGGDAQLPRLLPADPAARRAAEPVLRALGGEQAQLMQRLAALEQQRAVLAERAGAPPPRLGELLAERAALIERVGELGVAELSRLFVERGVGLPAFADLAAARDRLFHALGLTPPAHSRQDLDNFLRLLWDAERQGGLGADQKARADSIYARYAESMVQKLFSSPEQAARHRKTLLDLLHKMPEGVEIAPQDGTDMAFWAQVLGDAGDGPAVDQWIHATRRIADGAAEPRAGQRVYINPQPDITAAMLRVVIYRLILGEAAGPFKAKSHSGAGEVQRRAEGVTVYAEGDAGTALTVGHLLGMQAKKPGLFVPAVPRMTEPVGHGIGVGAEPLPGQRGKSFGEVRADAIAAALTRVATLPAEERTFRRFATLVDEELAKRGVDPRRPHLNLPQRPGE